MKVYTVEKETNRIALHGSALEARRVQNAECFRDEAEFEAIASGWTTARVIAIWNSLAGVTPVSRFKDRATGVSRIWTHIQNLPGEPPEQAPGEDITDAPPADKNGEAANSDITGKSRSLPGDQTTLTEEITSNAALGGDLRREEMDRHIELPESAERKPGPRAKSKTAEVIALLKREQGATVEEIMAAMQWQQHTTRALLSAGG